ncbi:sugar phosphate isomerase/epimerase [Streptomyces sp. MBT62]|uniref:sugar phosphate isomerase/epimerase family protein n=1 Tax=Streptomyces sp. MBT62 TaxID=2800410 RepID=UPI00190982EF|nr:sugar phosphate isomerase/epimerase family protein [Streptomyces sp. MBT62]MBK3563830.1 sugar phosphate isomerase/epimerase [Streptomyces sp. MBT62]
MRLAFSTLGLPGVSLAESVRLASEHGFQGLELRCTAGESVDIVMDAVAREKARHTLEAARVTALSVASYVKVAAPGPDASVLVDLREHLRLAADLDAVGVRVFPGAGEDVGLEADLRAVRRLTAIADEAQALGVRVLLETHDSHRAARDATRIVASVGHSAVGILWDVMHTWLAGESPSQTAAVLRDHLGYIQVKDVAGHTDLTPLPLGAGVLPLAECLSLVPEDCWVSWEYEAAWYPAATPLPDLLVAGAGYLGTLSGADGS